MSTSFPGTAGLLSAVPFEEKPNCTKIEKLRQQPWLQFTRLTMMAHCKTVHFFNLNKNVDFEFLNKLKKSDSRMAFSRTTLGMTMSRISPSRMAFRWMTLSGTTLNWMECHHGLFTVILGIPVFMLLCWELWSKISILWLSFWSMPFW